jgi:DNA polymerase-3 subunit gamma/tau
VEHQSLYRRFRSQRFAELIGQDHVTVPLRAAVRDGRTSHAYLFSGPRGTGKTSTARILAKALNCKNPVDGEPCDECESCVQIREGRSFDVFELDAASHSGVEAMRELTARAALTTPGRQKVYIVDEVHMLSTAASNALLKTLEEPPPHVVFVLATTDPQKVLPTIRSRTQHYSFRLLATDVLIDHLSAVADIAGLGVDHEVLATAARRGQGSARDALSSLEQLSLAPGDLVDQTNLTTLLNSLFADDRAGILHAVAQLLAAGHDPRNVARELVAELREFFLADIAPELCVVPSDEVAERAQRAREYSLRRTVGAIESTGRALVDMRDALDARAVLEVCLLGLTIDTPPHTSADTAPPARLAADSPPAAPAPAKPGPAASPTPAPTPPPPRPGAAGRSAAAQRGPTPVVQTTAQPLSQSHTRGGAEPAARTDFTRENLTLAWPDISASLGGTALGRLGDGYWSEVSESGVEWTVRGSHGINDATRAAVLRAIASHFFAEGAQRLTMTVNADGAKTEHTTSGARPDSPGRVRPAGSPGRVRPAGSPGRVRPADSPGRVRPADSAPTSRVDPRAGTGTSRSGSEATSNQRTSELGDDLEDELLTRDDLGEPLTPQSQLERLTATFPGAQLLNPQEPT